MEETLAPPVETARPTDETPLEFFASICGVLVLGLFALTFIFQNFEIPSSSMVGTLLVGDHVVVDRISLAPPTRWAPFVHYRNVKRGDVIVFYKPGELEPDGTHLFLVKRVVGIPGDRIHLRGGVVYLNGKPQNEPYAARPEDSDYEPYRDDFPAVPPPSNMPGLPATWALELPQHIEGEDLVVPPGKYFAMGDNRPYSLDSRYWGFVPRANIVGRPLFVYWSFITPESEIDKTSIGDRIGFMAHVVVHFLDQTRWRRTFHLVR